MDYDTVATGLFFFRKEAIVQSRMMGDEGMSKKEEHLRKPDWLKIKLNTNENYTGLKK